MFFFLSSELQRSRGIIKRRNKINKKGEEKGEKGRFTGANCHRIANTMRSYSRSYKDGRFSLSVRFPVGSVIPCSGFVNAFPALVDNSSLLVHSKGQGRQYVVFVSLLKTPFRSPCNVVRLGGDWRLELCSRVLRC